MNNLELKTPLNNTQLEILNLFNRELEEKELKDIKRLIIQYFAAKANRLANQVWDEKGWTNEDMDKLAFTHLRTPYQLK